MDSLSLVLIHGTIRKESLSGMVAENVYDFVSKVENVDTKLIHVSDLDFAKDDYGPDTKGRFDSVGDIMSKADAYIIITPEYNHSYPGTLKEFLDIFYKEYAKKPIGLVTISDGPWGGVRVAESLLPVIRALGAVALQRDVQFANMDTEKVAKFDDNNTKRLSGMFEELLWYARALKTARLNDVDKKSL